MNYEKVELLKQQANQWYDSQEVKTASINDYLSAIDRKLAELIVQECINCCGSDFGTKLIKQHWGIADEQV